LEYGKGIDLATKTKPSISVFFPCYNDKGTIGGLVTRALELLKDISNDYEVIVVDDGSTDGSRERLKEIESLHSNVRLVFHRENKGYGGALQSGFEAASKDLIFYTDGDAQYDINEMPLLVPLMTSDIDIVNGIKIGRGDSLYRVVIGHIYNFFIRNLFNLFVFDVDCDFRLIRRNMLEGINFMSSSGAICTELVKKLHMKGARFREVSVHHYPRTYGQSQFFNLNRVINTGRDLIKLWFQVVIARKI
jgi:glycosyltransferase involved in cell wall biosynthesis